MGLSKALRPVRWPRKRLTKFLNSYQPGGQAGFDPSSGIDPLSNGSVCLRDATLMQRLGVNAIRVYNLDPDLNHDDCASIFNAAGIYMLLDVNSPLSGQSLDRSSPATSYDLSYVNRTFAVVEAFGTYPNTLGFFSGNEVINEESTPDVPAYIRAVTRDIKEYIANHLSRSIGVGYSAADVRSVLQDSYNYLSCYLSNDTSSSIDFFGLNSYSWCGNSSFTASGYDVLVNMFSNASIPVFFSEYGCNNVYPRVFTEVPVLYGPQMTTLAGGFVYEYSQEVSNYGLVVLNDNDTVSLLQDYVNLQAQYDTLNITLLESANATATSQKAPACSTGLLTSGEFEPSFGLPAQPSGVSQLIQSGIPNPNRGKIVQVSDLTVSQTVYDVNGNAITGLKLNALSNDESNTPGSNDSGSSSGGSSTASGTATATGSKASSTSKGAAPAVIPRGEGSYLTVVAVTAAAFLGGLLLA